MADEAAENDPNDQLNRSSESVPIPNAELTELDILNASINEAEQFELTFEIVEKESVAENKNTDENNENEAIVDAFGFEVEAEEEDEETNKENTQIVKKTEAPLPQTPKPKKNSDSDIFSEQRKRKMYVTSTPKTKRLHK